MGVEFKRSRKAEIAGEVSIIAAFTDGAQLLERTIVKKISRTQPKRRTKGGFLVGLDPSRPGEPPKVLYNRLRQTIQSFVERKGRRIVAGAGSPERYARRLEAGYVGTDAQGRRVSQAPRPYLRPSFLETLPFIQALLRR